MDDKSLTIRVPKSWGRLALIVGVTAAIVAPLTAVATHSFTDVSSTNTFHEDIAWLADAGVTKGCNPPANTEYCPDDPVTRAQMSAFMRRLAENQVVDAGTLDGKQGVAYTNPVVNARANGITINSGQVGKLAQLSISTPAAGGLSINGVVGFGGVTGANSAIWIQVDDTTCVPIDENVSSVTWGFVGQSAGDGVTTSIAGAIPVSSGSHSVTLCGLAAGGVASEILTVGLVAEYATSVTRTGSLLSLGTLEALGLPPD